MISVKKYLGPMFPIVAAALLMLCILLLSRLGLSLWHFSRVNDANGWLPILFSGLRIDIATISIYFVLPSIATFFFSGKHFIGVAWSYFVRVWIVLGVVIIVFMETLTPAFIIEYDLRPNRLFIEYLSYPKEILSMLMTGYKAELAISIIVSVITLVLSWNWSGGVSSHLYYPKWYWRPMIAIIVLLVATMGARSTLGHRPLNPAMVAFSSDPLINDLVLNSAYSAAFAAKQMGSEASAFDYYPNMDKAEIISEIRSSMNVKNSAFIKGYQPSLAYHQASFKGKKKNIVILLLESHGALYVSSLGGLNISPNLDKLYKEGWAFKRMYATGTRSVRGIEAVTTGFSPTPARSVVKLAKSQTNFFSIASLLKMQQYHTQFIYGGESHFDNMKSFFLGNGFVDMQDFNTFEKPEYVGSWGASDEDLYVKAHRQLSQSNQRDKPIFSLIFSSSNHTPFEYPDNKIEPYNSPKDTVENAVKYADFALGKFIARAKQSDYWQDTVFAVIADHDARTFGASPMPIEHFQIPAIIFGGGIEPRIDNRLVSQIDLPPTLLSMAGVSSHNPMIGHDLTKEVPRDKQRAIMQRDKNFAWMNADNEVMILQPGIGISTYQYNAKAKATVEKTVHQALIKRAHANALWGSLAFSENFYSLFPSDNKRQESTLCPERCAQLGNTQ